MGNVVYFDPFNGASGDMILGALVDMGLPLDHLRTELAKLDLTAYSLAADKIEREGMQGVNFHVRLDDVSHGKPATHAGHHDWGSAGHHGRHFPEIRDLILNSGLRRAVKDQATQIFARLAEAEAKVHGSDVGTVHFHEVGAVDAIVDIVGACIGFDYFEVDQFYAAPLQLGFGTVTFSHGTWPVPAPATAELVKGFPTKIGNIESELTTPTGAAIITTLAEPVGKMPDITLTTTGCGAGDRDLPGIPNMLRLMLGRTWGAGAKAVHRAFQAETVFLLEANIDDMDAELCGFFLEKALETGALDVSYAPIQMKKSRPALQLSVLCKPQDRDRLVELIFRETTTLGVRVGPKERYFLERETRSVETDWGPVRVKRARLDGEVVNTAVEYEDLKAICEKTGLPMKEVRREVDRQVADLEP